MVCGTVSFFNMKGLYRINLNLWIMHAIPIMICYWPTPTLADKRFLGVFTKATEIFVLNINFRQKKVWTNSFGKELNLKEPDFYTSLGTEINRPPINAPDTFRHSQ